MAGKLGGMSPRTQLEYLLWQRDQTYENEVGLPSQVPSDVLTVFPTREIPEIAGGFVLNGSETVEDGAAIVAGAAVVVVVVVTGLVSHHLATPTSGSPKVELLQSTPPVKVLAVVKVPLAP